MEQRRSHIIHRRIRSFLNRMICIGVMIALCKCSPNPTNEDPMHEKVSAFPGAEGGGKYTTGGRGGMVYHVTTTEDDANKTGSLRYILSVPGKKIVVFDTSGTIFLQRELDITEGSVTIAGQTAPGDGICIANYPVVIKASNVIIRFVRSRMGDEKGVEGDALTCIGKSNILIDHCSFSWSTDECVGCYGNTDFTLQYCFITESLRQSVHSKDKHGYGGIWGGKNATFHHNLLAHHDSRNPRFDHSYVRDNKCLGPIDYVNNVVYNWGGNSTYGGEGIGEARQINIVGNYYKPGPATSSSKRERLLDPTIRCSNCSKLGTLIPGKFFMQGNYMSGSDKVTADNWSGSTVQTDEVRTDTRWTHGMTSISHEETAQEAFETVLEKSGCSLRRDAIDERIAGEVRQGTYTYKGSKGSTGGLIDTPSDVGGYPTYQTEKPLADTDHDGIPDEWETEHGLNPNDVWDGSKYTLSKEYTNVEIYLNSLVEHLY